jgi:hypothetical protein
MLTVSCNTSLRLYPIPFLLFLTVFACTTNKSKEKIQYASKGSLLLFDTATGKYIISLADKKLIATWESFRQAISKLDYTTLESLSFDSVICPDCISIGNGVMTGDTFYKNYAKDLFSNSFISLIFDSSKVRCSYDFDSTNFNAYPFLTTISDLKNPKVAEIFISYPVSNGDSEGTLGILGFIETKQGYKFFGYSTIP